MARVSVEIKITQPIFGMLVALMKKKRTYQNDMKSTNKTEMHMLGNELLPFGQFHDM